MFGVFKSLLYSHFTWYISFVTSDLWLSGLWLKGSSPLTWNVIFMVIRFKFEISSTLKWKNVIWNIRLVVIRSIVKNQLATHIKWLYIWFHKANILHEMCIKSDLQLKGSSSLTCNIRFMILRFIFNRQLATDMKDHDMKYQDLWSSEVQLNFFEFWIFCSPLMPNDYTSDFMKLICCMKWL